MHELRDPEWEAETDKLFCLASATGFSMNVDKHGSSKGWK